MKLDIIEAFGRHKIMMKRLLMAEKLLAERSKFRLFGDECRNIVPSSANPRRVLFGYDSGIGGYGG